MSTPIKLAFDFNKASNLSQNVGTTTYVHRTVATFTTNASQLEPGKFSNGINSFGSNNNVFILHNAGANMGANQRYVYLALATQVPIRLTKFAVNVGTNASTHSPTNPVVFAVEVSPSDNFAGAVSIGSFSSAVTTDQTVTMNFEIPSGITYMRLRVTSAIPDGSNYVAYENVKLVGSVIDNGPIELLYNFNTAAESARVVGTSVPLRHITSVFTGNAKAWEPGELANGVNVFLPDNNIFTVHNIGANLGTNQRYAYIGLATTVPLVLKQLNVSIGTFITGTPPASPGPLTLAIETAREDTFFPASLVGTLSSASRAVALTIGTIPGALFRSKS